MINNLYMPSGFETFADALGIKFNPYMNSIGEKFVNGETPKVAVRAGRRTGKTSMLTAIALFEACTQPNADVVVRAKHYRIATVLTDSIVSTVNAQVIKARQDNTITFVNGSTIRVIYDGQRGYHADILLIDEAAFIDGLGAGQSKTLLVSTPSEFTSTFNTIMRHDDSYEKYHIPNEDMSPGTVALGPHDIIERLGELPEFEISDSVLHIHDVPEHDLVLHTYDNYIGTDTIEPMFHHTIPLEPQHIIPIGEANQIISEDVHYNTADAHMIFTENYYMASENNEEAIAELQRRTLEVGDEIMHTGGHNWPESFHDSIDTPMFTGEVRAWTHELTDTMDQQPQDNMSAEQILGEIDGRTNNYDTGSA